MKRVSVVICTRNRAHAVAECLDHAAKAIQTAQMSRDQAEIVLVDNGSTDATRDVIGEWINSHPEIRLNLLSEPKPGLSWARNRGISVAFGDIVIFTDDDCHMANDYILKALAYDAADSEDVIRGGRIELGNPQDIPLTIKTSDEIARFSKSQHSAKSRSLAGFISGCNLVVRKSTLEKLGGFDTRLGAGTTIPGSEDTDYLARGYVAGIDIEYVPDMTVYHFHGRKTSADGKKLMRGYNTGSGAFYLKYLFKEIDLARPFVWDIHNALNEIKTGKNLYLPQYETSYRDVIQVNLLGMWRYACASLGACLAANSRGKHE